MNYACVIVQLNQRLVNPSEAQIYDCPQKEGRGNTCVCVWVCAVVTTASLQIKRLRWLMGLASVGEMAAQTQHTHTHTRTRRH